MGFAVVRIWCQVMPRPRRNYTHDEWGVLLRATRGHRLGFIVRFMHATGHGRWRCCALDWREMPEVRELRDEIAERRADARELAAHLNRDWRDMPVFVGWNGQRMNPKHLGDQLRDLLKQEKKDVVA